jgi:type I restriction enzyme, S subunit
MNFVVLDEVAKIDRTVASDKDCQILPYVGLEHIEKDTGHFSKDFKRDSETLLASKFKFSSSHVLYGKLRPYLNKVALPSFEGVCTTEILPILSNFKLLDRRYLWLIFLSPKFVAWASKSVSGANLPRLDPKELAQYQIPLPSLEEQKRIAKIAGKCDRLRRTRRYTQQLSDTYLQSVFLEMFGDPAINPMEWKIHFVENLLSSERTGTQCGPFGSLLKRHEYVENGIPVWGIDNLRSNQFVEEGSLFVAESKYKGLKNYSVEFGDILISRAGTTGRMCVANPKQSPSIIGTNLIKVSLDHKKILPDYFTALFSYFPKRVSQLRASGDEDAYSFINTGVLKSLKIPLPPLPLQEKFAQIVRRFERLRVQQRESDRQAEHLFQTVLHRAFSREL